MQESERQAEIDSSPSSFYLKQQQGQITSQNNMQNYDSLLYSEITENNQTLLNTPQHPFKQKNPLGSVSLSFNSINFQSMLKNTQQMESGQVSERQNIQSGDKNQVSNYNQNINNNQKNSIQQQVILQSSNDKKYQQSSSQNSQSQSNRNNNSNIQNQVFQHQNAFNRSPYKINEFQICTEEDEKENKDETIQNIEKIDLSGNMLKNMQDLNKFKSLVYLNLSYNRIQIIENIEMLVNLQYLNLSNNNIKEIPSIIERNTQLQHLLLSSNNISSINSIASLQKLLNLKELNLLDNPIQQCQDYKNYIKNNLKQIILLDQKNIHVSNLNSVGESWNSQLSFSNNTVNQSAHFQRKQNSKVQQVQQQQQQNNLIQPIQGLLESFSNNNNYNNNNNNTNSLYQNRQNHIYSFGSQQNDTPTNHLFGFEINIDYPQKLKKPQSLDFQYLTSQNQQNSPQQIRAAYYNNMGDLNRSITEIETEFDSDGNVLDKQFQEQRIFYSNAKSSKKNFKAFLEFQNQLQMQNQYLASPLNNEQSVILFENMNSSEKHNRSVWQNNTQERNEQTFSESANKNSFLIDSKIQQQRQGNEIENDLQSSFNFKRDKNLETESQVQNLQNQFDQIQSNDQNLIQNKTLRRNLAYEEQVGNNFLPHLSEEEAYRLKKCLFQQNNDKIQILSNQQFNHSKQEDENTNNKKKDRNNEDNYDEVNLTNIHSISNYVYDESTAKKANQQINFIQPQKNQQQILPPPAPSTLPIPSLKEEQGQINKDKFKTSPFLDQIANNSGSKQNEQEQNGNQLNNVSQLQSLFDNIESHRGDFLLQDFSQIYASKVNTSDVLGIQFTPQNHSSNNNNMNQIEYISPTEESTINSNIMNSEKQCQTVANTLNILNNQLKALHESFQDYNSNLDSTAEKSNQLIQKIIKCTEDSQKESIKEKEKLVQDIQLFKNLVSSSFIQINIFVEEFGLQINTFMKIIQECGESKCDQLNNEGIIPKISTNTLNNINEIFEQIQNNNNQLFINANRMTEEINRAKNIQNDFLVEKLNQNIEKIISLFKEISNLHLTCCDTFESIEHTSERLTKFFIHIVRLFQAKQVIQFSNHKRNLSNQTNNSCNQTIQMKQPSSSTNISKDHGQANSKLNRQQSTKDFNIQNNNNNNNNNKNQQFQNNDKEKKGIAASSNQQNQQFQENKNQNSNRDSQKQESFDRNLEKQEDLKTPKSNNNNTNTNMNSNNSRIGYTPLQEGFSEEEQKKLMNSNIEQIQQQMNNYRKEIQQKHLKNQKSEELKLEELDPSQRINILQQNISNTHIFPFPTQYMNQQLSNINTSFSNEVQIKSNIPISPHLTTNSPSTNISQLKNNSQKPTQYQQELEILRFKFSDFEKTSLMRYDNLLKAKEQVEKDYNQIVQNYSELQQNYESILVKYSGLQSKYEESLSLRDKNNNEIEREEFISQISQLKLRVNDLEKYVSSSENQKQLLLKDKQILKEQLSLVQKDYESLEKQNQININQNQKLIDNNKDLAQQNQQLLLRLTEAENTVLSMKQVLTPRLHTQQQSDQHQEYTSNQEKQYSHKKSLSQQLNNQYNNNNNQATILQQGQNQIICNEELSQLLKNMLQNVNTNMQQNTQIIQLLGSKDTLINNQTQSDNLNENQYEAHQEWSEMLKMQIKQKQLLYKQILALAAIISTIQSNDEKKLQECIKKITSLQETTNQSTQTDLNSLVNTQYQFFDSIISPPSKTSTVITQQTNNNITSNNQNINQNNNTASNNNTLEDSNTKSNIMTATTMTLPNILESVRKHQHNVMQAKLKSNTTVNSSSTASEKLYKLAAQRYEEETTKNLKHKKNSNQPCEKWFNNSPERYCGQQNSKPAQNEEKIDEVNQSSSQNSSSTQNKSLQKSRQLLKQMTDLANDKKSFLAEDSAFLQTKKKVANNDFKQGDQSTSSGNKKNVSKLINDLHSQMDKKTFRNSNSSNINNAHAINQSDIILNNTTTNKKSKREQTKSPSAQTLTKNCQKNIILSNHNSNNSQQILVNNFLKKEFKYPSKGSQSSLLNQSHHLTNKTQQSQNQSSSVLHLTQINSNSNNPNNASNISHYKSNSNIIDRVSMEHSKKQKNCLKSVIKAYKNIETLRKMQDILKNEDNFTAFLNKTTTNIHINQSFNNNHHNNIPINQFNINHQNNQNSNLIENCTNNQITKILKKVTRSQSNLSTQNGQKVTNSVTQIHNQDANTKRDKSKE
ncbi:hypothetical protein TTHERM_00790610 (macronuclear) [Tetrahymena thermophila SB210]|uniref:Uncharacterized protein n=1 Tax=Tetrahymena thermophila (strain SB210) TaxID=312017 RepID=Q24DS6_TETTS|nr:hypothetical protein TTHERM_00790610 [Tetrahymena thermophila SB210]EAS05914.2 hypothetical protein TTHERM_00790610 [Tetrahymena thermophila SB210]|eukprot:XP_001026159.2 hypothetical protein TTHERM_00790610 [Tetrahymena thermophila SB210]